MDENEKTNVTVEQMALEERKFLHELSNLLVVAHGMSTFVQQSLVNNPESHPGNVDKINKAVDALNRINQILRNRRSILHGLTIK